MPDISGISGPNGPDHVRKNAGVNRSDPKASVFISPEDSVEISSEASKKAEVAEYVAKLRELPAVRQEVVDRIKSEIERGVYEPDKKIDEALDNMLDEMRIGRPATQE